MFYTVERSRSHQPVFFMRMFKRSLQQGRNERGAEAYGCLYVAGAKRCENAAGVPFQHPISGGNGACR